MGAVASVVSGLAGEVLRPRHAPSAGPRDQDADLVFRPGLTVAQLLDSCAAHLDSAQLPPPLPRSWSPSFPPHTSPPPGTDITGANRDISSYYLLVFSCIKIVDRKNHDVQWQLLVDR